MSHEDIISIPLESDKDLPLLANTDDFYVKHYYIRLECNLRKKVFNGQLIINLQPSIQAKKVPSSHDIVCILDSKNIHIQSIEEISVHHDESDNLEYKSSDEKLFNLNGDPLQFKVQPWSLNIWKRGVKDASNFPRLIKINYQTDPNGSSVTWTNDQNGRECVFTQGAWINNRSLLPCQEPPIAMATWQAWIISPDHTKVVMSGDNEPIITQHNEKVCSYYHAESKLPMSTLALAIGYWDDTSIHKCSCPCKLYGPSPLIEEFYRELSTYVPKCLEMAEKYLGPYPFKRLNFLVLPRCFSGLGLASPNVIFLSQSIVSKNGCLKIRITHEISHSWFGLLIGALDWTEEWLSEGFATFLEDLIHDTTSEISDEVKELRAYLRYKNLCNELENTESELQVLRPLGNGENSDKNLTSVKNGMNPDKCFTQVHYIKGYFLLRFIYQKLGHEVFINFLKNFVQKFCFKLVTSRDVLDFLFETKPHDANDHLLRQICDRWLDLPGIPVELKNFKLSDSNQKYLQVVTEFDKWTSHEKMYLSQGKRPKFEFQIHYFQADLAEEQICLLMEFLLDLETIPKEILFHINSLYDLDYCQADILHRWCELIIKHRYHEKYYVISKFLCEHQAMGVYLYGECIISSDKKLNKLAKNVYEELKNEMDLSAQITVAEMLGIG